MNPLVPSRVLLVALACLGTRAEAETDLPNLLLIVADDMGYGDLGCYGSLQIQTPHLDRLAASGVRCTDGYVASCVCAPSRAGLLTGRSGSRFGFEHNLHHPDYLAPEFAGIPLDEPLISERLQALGYRTGLVGKWHLGKALDEQHPLRRGFDFFFGMLGGSHGYWPTLKKNSLLYGDEKPESIRTPYLTDWFTLEALDFIDSAGKASNADADRPWFLFLSYNTPHGPMQARPEDLELYAHIVNEKRRAYCAMQHCMDQNIGRLVERLAARGELENTMIVFISDNGGSVEVSHAVNAPLRGGKGTFLEGGVRVPTLYHWPEALEPQVYTRPVSALDVMATFVTAAGGSGPAPGDRQEREGRKPKEGPIYDSVDLMPFFQGTKEGDPHEALIWRMALRGAAVRAGDWKYLRPASQPPQLYNLAEDPGETRDLLQAEPERGLAMLARLNKWETTLERNPMFISAAYWAGYNRRLYARQHSLVQPGPEDDEDIWAFTWEGR